MCYEQCYEQGMFSTKSYTNSHEIELIIFLSPTVQATFHAHNHAKNTTHSSQLFTGKMFVRWSLDKPFAEICDRTCSSLKIGITLTFLSDIKQKWPKRKFLKIKRGLQKPPWNLWLTLFQSISTEYNELFLFICDKIWEKEPNIGTFEFWGIGNTG